MLYTDPMFTVKQLAKLAGITPRTLRFYDQIGLLKPTQLGENGYRYYGDDAVICLQQIMLYRELELPLDEIRQIMQRPEFDVAGALESHRVELRKRIKRLEQLLGTVEQTLAYSKGKQAMSPKQLFEGFSEEQQAAYEQEAMQQYDPEIVKASNRKWRSYTAAQKEQILAEGSAVYQDFVDAMAQGAASAAARACIERWRRHMDYFWTPNEEQLLGIAEGYLSDARFKATFDRIHPHLAEFIRDAVKASLS